MRPKGGVLACLEGVSSSLSGGCSAICSSWCGNEKINQDDFERLINFLDAVPILRKHLPRAELPRVAEAFKQKQFEVGQTVIEQGKEGTCLYIIKSGEASVTVDGCERATLYALDYFGGHTITEKRANFATITAKGNQPFVTLAMAREDFEAFGLHKYLKFPRRPAIYEGKRTDAINNHSEPPIAGIDDSGSTPITPAEVDFLSQVIRANPNLRQSLEGVGEKLEVLVRSARRCQVKAGTYITKAGDLPEVLYVVADGSFDIIPGSAQEHKSVEATIRNMTKVQKRMDAKQKFVAGLERTVGSQIAGKNGNGNRSTSVRVERGPSAMTTNKLNAFRATSLIGGKTYHQRDIAYKSGDFVARVVFGSKELSQEVGKVVRVRGLHGKVEVDWGDPDLPDDHRLQVVNVKEIRPAKDLAPIAVLTQGMCYGEFSLLYNTRLTTNCRAKENSSVFAISRSDFKEAFSRRNAQSEDDIRLLDDCLLFCPLVRSERMEIARSAAGTFEFKPGERVLHQGDELKEVFLYVIKHGSCVIRKGEKDSTGRDKVADLATLSRAGYFGERTIFRKEKSSEFSVDAGAEGLTCLAVHEEIIRRFVTDSAKDNADMTTFGTPSFDHDVVKYHRLLPTNNVKVDVPLQSLQVLRLLGQGGFGSVFLVQNGQKYALKRLSKGWVMQAKAQRQVALERDLLAMVDSEFIIKLYKTYKDDQYVYMLLELCEGGHLYQLLADVKQAGVALLPSSVMFYISSVSIAMGHLHERHIAYRDLKAENVLLDSRGFVKLCDMGFAKFVVDKAHTLLGTPEYMAPEMIDPPHSHDHMVDWWALGVLTFELFTGQDPWYDHGLDSDDPMAQLLAIRDSHDDGIPERLIPRHQTAALEFIKRLLCTNPKRRLGFNGDAAQVQQDPWFTSKNFDFSALLRQEVQPPELPQGREAVPVELTPSGILVETDDGLFALAPDDTSDWDAAF